MVEFRGMLYLWDAEGESDGLLSRVMETRVLGLFSYNSNEGPAWVNTICIVLSLLGLSVQDLCSNVLSGT